ncbi:cytochrome P450 [Hygrophoropsis aurantiaca]|uniref:Cytochrome P450 n=1 Tax=Hygrophoropsis aurantiaca TaxID=72124 RepID=A0ACB8ACV8_9AGAM|nr:cytochrome P450 [Hygrophoropsis aurantiaca]
MQLRKAHQLLRGLLESPQEYEEHLQLHSSSLIMSAVYDYETAPRDDPFVTIINKTLVILLELVQPQLTAILGTFPFILSLPTWFPGMSFKGRAALSRQYAAKWLSEPFQYVQERMKSGASAPSMVSDALEKWQNEDESGEMTAAIRETAATVFLGASETTTSTLKIFVLAMVLHPEVQERAWLSIQSVIGTTRLPNFDDRASLPYIDAVLRETLRWYPAIPTGNGSYYIPAFERADPPQAFHAQLILKMCIMDITYPKQRSLTDDTCSIAFGFGRRFCIGKHVADASLWSSMALMLAVFKFSKQKDDKGADIDFEPRWFSGLATHPLPFPCVITPRHEGMDMGKLDDLIAARI